MEQNKNIKNIDLATATIEELSLFIIDGISDNERLAEILNKNDKMIAVARQALTEKRQEKQRAEALKSTKIPEGQNVAN